MCILKFSFCELNNLYFLLLNRLPSIIIVSYQNINIQLKYLVPKCIMRNDCQYTIILRKKIFHDEKLCNNNNDKRKKLILFSILVFRSGCYLDRRSSRFSDSTAFTGCEFFTHFIRRRLFRSPTAQITRQTNIM